MRRSVVVVFVGSVGATAIAAAACSGAVAPREQQQLQTRLDGTATGDGKTCSWEGTAAYAARSDQAIAVGPFNIGDNFKSLDGCNDCTCGARGIMCTVRSCQSPTPTLGGCFSSAGDLDPAMRTCASASDCTIVTFAQNCCGQLRAAGVNSSSQSKAQTCGDDRTKGFPACGCYAEGTVADDGTSNAIGGTSTGANARVACSAAGQCETTFGETSTLKWYATCGYPVCQAPGESDAGPPPPSCPTEGSSCTTKGQTCGTPSSSNCGSILVCEDHDPKLSGCPVSTRKAKENISYVDAAELQKLHDETLSMRLATYRYKGPFVDPKDPNAKHLGFIIEDQPQSLAVDRLHGRVDLYGYMSMAVATMQVQEKEIAELRSELARVKESCSQAR